jgi:hypothetical protein
MSDRHVERLTGSVQDGLVGSRLSEQSSVPSAEIDEQPLRGRDLSPFSARSASQISHSG